ncbi:ABC transporter substrate-binding protein [Rhodopila sp.]|jgi:NitT/TauT family transport system substrate-binding protein|uniref:ABC transporter substrate-binding protein n=1 Tax=Rhodopila sp. TaxID=2480087 RepID=UPI002C016D19|nr:ABC transporter substrate-binding protein [Rhodopila sp.]HVZ06681.1 ABC transporter substrate-binding protein [Rhodopila sp.]
MRWLKNTAWCLICLAAVGLAAISGSARAEVTEVRFAQQFSMGYLQFNVMKHRNLLAKHAQQLGLGELKTVFVTFNGPDMMNDALLSGSIDIASGGMPGLLTIWAKTRGSAQEVRGVSAMSQQPLWLNSRNPAVHSIKDFTDADRIALPAVKVSAQAVLLEMAAVREWGDAAYGKLDHLTFSLSPPDATAGLVAGSGDFNAAFTVPPYQNIQLRNPAVHTVLSSADIVGPSSGGMAWTTKRFHDANPKVYRAILDSMEEASEFIAAHPKETAAFYTADSNGKVDQALMEQLLSDPAFRYILTPHGTMKWASFMYKVGRIKAAPASWKDLFWPELHDRDGD